MKKLFMLLFISTATFLAANGSYSEEDDSEYHQEQGVYGHSHDLEWEDQQNWRYDRKAYLNGETQNKFYRGEHPNGKGGIGYDDPTGP